MYPTHPVLLVSLHSTNQPEGKDVSALANIVMLRRQYRSALYIPPVAIGGITPRAGYPSARAIGAGGGAVN